MPDSVPSHIETLFSSFLAIVCDERTVNCGSDYELFRREACLLVPEDPSLLGLILQLTRMLGDPRVAREAALNGTYCSTATAALPDDSEFLVHLVFNPHAMGETTDWVWEGKPKATAAILVQLVAEGLSDHPALACSLVRPSV